MSLPRWPEWLSADHLVQDGRSSGRPVYLSDTSTSLLVWLGHRLVTVSWEVVPSWNSFLCAKFEDATREFRVQKSMRWDCISRSFPALLQRGRALAQQNCCCWGKVGAWSISCNTQVYGGSPFCSLGKGGMVPSLLGRCLWSHPPGAGGTYRTAHGSALGTPLPWRSPAVVQLLTHGSGIQMCDYCSMSWHL